jgi:hypothetical protein
MHIPLETQVATATDRLNYKPSSSTSSDESLELINSWIKNCVERHPHCDVGHSNWTPKRLLHVGVSPPRLVKCGNIGGRYTTLSHYRAK